MTIKTALCMALLVTFAMATPIVINTNVYEQYGVLMRTEDYINNANAHITDPSLFIGLAHISIDQHPDLTWYMQVSIWHQIAFATNVVLKGPATANKASLLPPIHVLATGASAGSNFSPFEDYFPVTDTILTYLRDGLLYFEITSDGATSGAIRGQIQPRDDLLMTFISNSVSTNIFKAELGMALIETEPIAGKLQPDRLAIRFWILSTINKGEWLLTNTLGQQLGPLGTITQTSLYVNAVFYDAANVGSITISDLIVCTSQNATNQNTTASTLQSSNLVLGILVDTVRTTLNPFIRLQNIGANQTKSSKKNKK